MDFQFNFTINENFHHHAITDDDQSSRYIHPEKIIFKIYYQPPPHQFGDQKIRFPCCYCLQSISNPQKTYFGYTYNPYKRLRQHNGEITGGAKRTSSCRPWKLIFFVAGFADNHEGLQFEYRLHHPKIRGKGIKYRIKVLKKIVSMEKWTSNSPYSYTRHLYIYWCCPTQNHNYGIFSNNPNVSEFVLIQ